MFVCCCSVWRRFVACSAGTDIGEAGASWAGGRRKLQQPFFCQERCFPFFLFFSSSSVVSRCCSSLFRRPLIIAVFTVVGFMLVFISFRWLLSLAICFVDRLSLSLICVSRCCFSYFLIVSLHAVSCRCFLPVFSHQGSIHFRFHPLTIFFHIYMCRKI